VIVALLSVGVYASVASTNEAQSNDLDQLPCCVHHFPLSVFRVLNFLSFCIMRTARVVKGLSGDSVGRVHSICVSCLCM